MAHRSFVDTAGTAWDVWDVVPRWIERRVGERRAPQSAPSAEERRRAGERRVRTDPHELRVRVSPGMESGWLAFSSRDEKRRYAPIPEGWEGAPESLLESLCRQARQVPTLGKRLVE